MDINDKDVFRELNHIKIDLSKLDNIDIQMDEVQHKKLKSNIIKNINFLKTRKKTKLKYISAAALASVFLTGSICIVNPAIASEIPIVNSIIGKNFETNTDYKDYVHSVGKTVSSNGVDITLKEVVSDNDTIMVGYLIKSNRPLKELFPDDMPGPGNGSFKIDGKMIGASGQFQFENIDAHSYTLYELYDLSKFTLPSKYKLDINYENVGNIKGDWSFNIAMNIGDIKKVSKDYTINKNFQLPNGDINIKNITTSPISFKMNYTRANKSDISLDDWNIITDKGEQLYCTSLFTSDESDNFAIRTFTPAKQTPSKITVVNLINDYSKKSPDETKEMSTLPVVFKSENLGTLTINRVDKLDDKILVYVHSDSILPITLAEQLSIIDKNSANTEFNSLQTNWTKIKYGESFKDLIIEYTSGYKSIYSKDGNYQFSFKNGSNITIDPKFKMEIELK